jgi:site-specific recombinase XerD
MRLSELVGLNLQSFDSELKTVRVIGKGKKERMIYLNDAAREATRDYIRLRLDPNYIATSTNALFLSRRQERISPKTVQWMVNKYLSIAGLGTRGLSVHKLRHTAATLMYQYGNVDVLAIKEMLGHESLSTTQIYTHIMDEQLQKAADANPLSSVKAPKRPVFLDESEASGKDK